MWEWLQDASNLEQLAATVVAVAALVATRLSDEQRGWLGVLARFVNLLALNVGKAKNDPTQQ